MILMPCNNCRRNIWCTLQVQKRMALRGQGLTVARFTCQLMRDDYRVGQRVSVMLKCYEYDEEAEASFLGTVMMWKGRKLLIHLDTGRSVDDEHESQKALVKVWPKWATPLAEPAKPTCDYCHLPTGAIVKDWICGCQPGWHFAKQDWGALYPEQDA